MKSNVMMGGAAIAGALLLAIGCSSDPSGPSESTGGTGGKGVVAGKGGGDIGFQAAGGSSAGASAQGGTSAGGTSAGGASAGQPSMGGASAGTGGFAGAPEPPAPFKSLPAGIALELDPATPAGLTLTTSSITQDTNSSLFYSEWLGELHNGTSTPQCLIQISGAFKSAAGDTIIDFDTYASGSPYKIGTSTSVSTCIGAGESAPVWANDLTGHALALESITKLAVKITPFIVHDAVPHPSTPTLGPLTKTYEASFKDWQIAGSATAVSDIYNVGLVFWAKSGDFYVDSQKVYHLENLAKGSPWAFDTSPLGLETVTLTSVLPQFSFIDGLKGAAASIKYDKPTAAIAAARDLAVFSWDSTVSRRDQYHQATH